MITQKSLGWQGSILVTILLSLSCGFCFATPVNDAFTNAAILSGFPVSASGDNTDATGEPGEPPDLLGNKTVWWEWTAPVSGKVILTDAGSAGTPWIAVYTGNSLASL